MNDKIINLGAKGIMILLIVIGVILSYIVISYGNPQAYKDNDMYQMGREVALKEGKDKSMTQAELDNFIMTTGQAMKDELSATQDSNVFNAIMFTLIIFIVTAGVVLLGSVFGLVLDPKKYLMGVVGVIVLFILVYAVWAGSSDELPAKLVEANNNMISDGKNPIYENSGMKLAGGAIWSTVVLLVLAVIAWVGSAVYKVVNS